MVRMALGNMSLKQIFSLEKCFFKNRFENNFSNPLSDLVTFSSDTTCNTPHPLVSLTKGMH